MTALRQRMLEDMQVRNLSPHTQRAYVETIARFARYFGRSPAELGPNEIRTYQVYLTCQRKLAPSSLEIAVCALRFLYKVTLKHPWSFHDVIPAPKKPRPLPVVLSPDEVIHFLTCVTRPAPRTILTTCYAAGLRISEAVRRHSSTRVSAFSSIAGRSAVLVGPCGGRPESCWSSSSSCSWSQRARSDHRTLSLPLVCGRTVNPATTN